LQRTIEWFEEMQGHLGNPHKPEAEKAALHFQADALVYHERLGRIAEILGVSHPIPDVPVLSELALTLVENSKSDLPTAIAKKRTELASAEWQERDAIAVFSDQGRLQVAGKSSDKVRKEETILHPVTYWDVDAALLALDQKRAVRERVEADIDLLQGHTTRKAATVAEAFADTLVAEKTTPAKLIDKMVSGWVSRKIVPPELASYEAAVKALEDEERSLGDDLGDLVRHELSDSEEADKIRARQTEVCDLLNITSERRLQKYRELAASIVDAAMKGDETALPRIKPLVTFGARLDSCYFNAVVISGLRALRSE